MLIRICEQIVLSLVFLAFLAHNTLCRMQPAVVLQTISVEGVPQFVLDYGNSIRSS
jgi:hypothetical protein